MPTVHAYNAGMQYTLRSIPEDVDFALRAKAASQGKSLNEIAIEVLRQGLSLSSPLTKKRDLSEFVGSWTEPDPEFDKAIAECRQIDPEDWK